MRVLLTNDVFWAFLLTFIDNKFYVFIRSCSEMLSGAINKGGSFKIVVNDKILTNLGK